VGADREIQETRNIGFYEQYTAGTLYIKEFLAFQLAPLTRHARPELDAWHREFMDRHIRPLIGDKARQLVNQHLAGGDLCAVVTATNSFVTGAIVREFGIPHLIGTVAAVDVASGAFSGSPRGTPSFRDGKIERVESGQLHRELVLQRLAQRPAADGQGPDAGGGRPGRQTAPAQ